MRDGLIIVVLLFVVLNLRSGTSQPASQLHHRSTVFVRMFVQGDAFAVARICRNVDWREKSVKRWRLHCDIIFVNDLVEPFWRKKESEQSRVGAT